MDNMNRKAEKRFDFFNVNRFICTRRKILRNLIFLCFLISVGFFIGGSAQIKAKPDLTPDVLLAEFKIAGGPKPIILPISFDGKEYMFLLDTGASHTIFDNSLKEKLGKPIRAIRGRAANGEIINGELFKAPRAYLGSIDFRNCRKVAALDLGPIRSNLDQRIRGIIGIDLLKKFVVQMDFDNKKILFLKSKKKGIISSIFQPAKNTHPEWGQPVSIRFSGRCPYVKGHVDNTKVDFLIDTGYFKLFADNPTFSEFTGALKAKTFEKVTTNANIKSGSSVDVTAAGKRQSDFSTMITIGGFSLGDAEYHDICFYKENGNRLGIPFLSKHLVTFDFPNKKMYLKKGMYFDGTEKAPLRYRDVGLVLRRNEGSIFVDSVDPNSQADVQGFK